MAACDTGRCIVERCLDDVWCATYLVSNGKSFVLSLPPRQRCRAMAWSAFDDPDAWDPFVSEECEDLLWYDTLHESPPPAALGAAAVQSACQATTESGSAVTCSTPPPAKAKAAMVQQPTVALPAYPEPASGGQPPMKRPRLQAESSAPITCIACPSHGSAASSEVAQSGSAAIQVKSEERRSG